MTASMVHVTNLTPGSANPIDLHPHRTKLMGYWTLDDNTVGLYKLNAVDPELESAWFQPLNL
jgi:hypothetical protein